MFVTVGFPATDRPPGNGSAKVIRDNGRVGFGFLNTAALTGMAISPVVSGFLGATSIRGVFVLSGVVLALVALIVSRVMIERGLRAERPIVEDT